MTIEKLPFIYGTQYYRPPTPPTDEWENDFRKIKAMGFNTVRFWAYWGWHERNSGIFSWDDSDLFFYLAQKYELKVTLCINMEAPPSWLKITNPLQNQEGVVHRAHFIGTKFPCFDDKAIRTAGTQFIETIVQRYKDQDALLAWEPWNEHRRRRGECVCPASVEAYQKWIETKFGAIENFNKTFGKVYHDWSDISPCTYGNEWSEAFLFVKWAEHSVFETVKWVVDIIRRFDPDHLIVPHAGVPMIKSSRTGEPCDDIEVGMLGDFYSSSHPVDSEAVSQKYGTNEPIDADDPDSYAGAGLLIGDWLRAVSPYYWSQEIYSDCTTTWEHRDPRTLQMWVWELISCGCKGIIYWQFKPERFASESDGYGLVSLNGCDTDRSLAVARIAETIHANEDLLKSSQPVPSEIAIVYDPDSDLLSEIEGNRITYLGSIYKQNLHGLYDLFADLNQSVDLLPSPYLKERISAYRLVWLPYHLMLTEEQARICLDYVNSGGILVSEPCLGFRAPNTWVRTGNIPAYGMDQIFGAREIYRTIEKQERLISFPDWSLSEVRFRRYTVELEVIDGNPVGVFSNSNMPFAVEKIHDKGRTLLLGGFVGLSSPGAMKKFLPTLLEKEGLVISNIFLVFDENDELLKESNYNVRWRRHITSDGRELLFIFNYDTKPRVLRWASPVIGTYIDIITQTKIVDGALTLNPKQTMCIVLNCYEFFT